MFSSVKLLSILQLPSKNCCFLYFRFRCGRLRLGDRILKVNNTEVASAEHRVAVEVGRNVFIQKYLQALKNSGSSVRLRVLHDPQPAGLKEVIVRKPQSRAVLGINIHGGVGKPFKHSALEPSDEGIFVEKVCFLSIFYSFLG